MILRTSPLSPFGRKVRMSALILGLGAEMTVVDADTASATDSLRRENPLGKIPTLVLDDGTTLFDSRVIVQYLDHLAGGDRLVPADPQARFAALRLEALADGIADAALLQVYEARWREPERRAPAWLEHQAGKVSRGLGALEAAAPGDAVTVGEVALASTLGYLDLRFERAWRAQYPALVAWLDRFAAVVPAFAATHAAAA